MKSGASESSYFFLEEYYKFPKNIIVSHLPQELQQSNKPVKVLWSQHSYDQPHYLNFDFSNDLANASVRAPFSTIRQSATGNYNYGWFGRDSSVTIERMNFSNDLTAPTPRGSLSLARNGSAATGNSNYGWFGGGYASSTVDRINFSNDSSTASVRGRLSLARYNFAATSNSTK